jgi:hypothetical protein
MTEKFPAIPPLSLQEEFAGVVTTEGSVESLRGRMGASQSTRHPIYDRAGVEGLFESLPALSFVEGLSESFA